MPWYAWVLIGAFALGPVLNVLTIGMPREPVTPPYVVLNGVTSALAIWAIVSLAT